MNTSTDLVWENNELDFNGNGVCDYSKIEIVSTSEAMCDIVTIVLDDGSKYSLKYEGRNSDKEDFITARAAKIISSTRDSLVIEITDTKSNYGSTDLHVLSLRENDKGMDEVLTILDNKDKIDEFISSYYPLDIINITITEEEQLICFDNQICKNMIQVTVYEREPIFLFWQDDSWKIK